MTAGSYLWNTRCDKIIISPLLTWKTIFQPKANFAIDFVIDLRIDFVIDFIIDSVIEFVIDFEIDLR